MNSRWLIVTIIFIALCATVLTACGKCDRQYLQKTDEGWWECYDPDRIYIYLCYHGYGDDVHMTCCDNPFCGQFPELKADLE